LKGVIAEGHGYFIHSGMPGWEDTQMTSWGSWLASKSVNAGQAVLHGNIAALGAA